MSNIVPKNSDVGQLGRLNRRWLELHTKLAHIESIKLGSADLATPAANELHLTSGGVLKLGANDIALKGDVDQLSALLNAFLSETGDDGVGTIVASFGTTYDTLRELIDGLETLSNYATTAYVDTQVAAVTLSVTQNAASITNIQGSITALESADTAIGNRIGALTLGSLTDVTLGTVSSGSVLKYNGTAWAAGTDDDTSLTTSGSLNAIQIAGASGQLSDAQVFITGSGGSAEISRDGDSSGVFARLTSLESSPATTTLGSLTDVSLGTLSSNNSGGALVYDHSSGEWTAGTISIAGLQTSIDNLVAGTAGLSQGSQNELQAGDGNGSFLARGLFIDDVTTGATVTGLNLNVKNINTAFNIEADKITFRYSQGTLGGTLTGTASTLSFNGDAMATRSYVNSVAGSGVSVTGNTNQLEVSDGSGDLKPVDLSVAFTGSTLTSIIPTNSEQVDLGSASNKFRHLYLSPNSLFLGDTEVTLTGSTLSVGGAAIAKANDLNTLETTVTNLSTTVSGHTSDIGANTTGVSDNATNISTNASSISALNTTVSSHTTTLASHASTLSSHNTTLSGHTTSINTNTTNIGSNTSNISTNAGNISTNTSNISTNTGNIAANVTSIGVNASSITSILSDVSSLSSSLSSVNSSISGFQTEIDATQTGAGLNSDGSYSANTAATFISSATSLKNADNLLNDQLATVTSDLSSLQSTVQTIQSGNADDVTALQTEIDDTQTGAGLGTGGAYTANSSSNYIQSATSLKTADDALDAQIKTNADAISVNASSITSVLSRVTTLEANDLDDLVVVSNSNALSYSSANNTLTLTDANIAAGEATSLASEVALLLSGDVTASAVTFTSGGTYTLTTSLSSALASTISNLKSDVASKQSALNFDGSLTLSASTLSLTDSYARGLLSAGGDLSYNSGTGAFSVTTYKSADFDTDLGNKTTDDVSEGSSNLYYTDARVASYLSTNSYADQSYVSTQISNLVDSAPGTLDTLNELAAALGDDPNFSTTVTNSIATKQTSLTLVDNGTLGSGLSLASSGTLTYTGPTNSSIIGVFSGGNNIAITSTGTISATGVLDAQVSNLDNLDTDDLSEGSTNQYFTNARARSAVSASGDLSYNSSTGAFSFTERTDAEVNTLFDSRLSTKNTDNLAEGSSNLYYTNTRVRGAISASGDLSYDASTGQFSVTTYKSTNFDSNLASKTTDNLSEGSNNLYYTDARSRSAVSASGDLSYNSSTGAFSFTERTDAEARGLISATNIGGDGSISYDSSTGEISYEGPSASQVRAHFSAGNNISIAAGVISLSDTLVYTGHVLEAFDHGTITSSHSSVSDYGAVSSDTIYHSVDLGGLDNGSLI